MKLWLGLVVLCLIFSAFYAGAFVGPADRKVRNLFIALALALGIAVAALWLRSGGGDDDETRPAACGAVRC